MTAPDPAAGRDPRLVSLLTDHGPVTVENTVWPGGLSLRFSLYLGQFELPDDLVTSVRCLTTVGRQLLVCEDAHPTTHVWPGGRREPGESWAETAQREVQEETGWKIAADSVTMLGFVHFRHLTPVPPQHPHPSPDFLQVVLHARASGGAAGWIDTEGYVLRSYLVDLEAADSLAITQAEKRAVQRVRLLLSSAPEA